MSVCCLLWPWLWLSPLIPVSGQEPRAAADEAYLLGPVSWPPVRVAAVEPDGTVRFVPAVNAPSPRAADWWVATEGHYLLASPQVLSGFMTSPSSKPLDRLVRVEVIDIGETHALTARGGPEVATALKVGDIVMLARPGRMATARIRALPTVIPLLSPGDPRAPRREHGRRPRGRPVVRVDQ
jgi:hypothetical protein